MRRRCDGRLGTCCLRRRRSLEPIPLPQMREPGHRGACDPRGFEPDQLQAVWRGARHLARAQGAGPARHVLVGMARELRSSSIVSGGAGGVVTGQVHEAGASLCGERHLYTVMRGIFPAGEPRKARSGAVGLGERDPMPPPAEANTSCRPSAAHGRAAGWVALRAFLRA
jgi:hypothetical protein